MRWPWAVTEEAPVEPEPLPGEQFIYISPVRNPAHRYHVWVGSHSTGCWQAWLEDRCGSVQAAEKRVALRQKDGWDTKIEDTWAT